jgi:hypothetical protein
MLLALLLTLATTTAPAPLVASTTLRWRSVEIDDPAFANPNFDDAGWPSVEAVGRNASAMAGGIIWYRATVDIDDDTTGAGLALPRMVGRHTLYVDGAAVADVGADNDDLLVTPPSALALPPLHAHSTIALRVVLPPLSAMVPLERPGAPLLAALPLARAAAAEARAGDAADAAPLRFVGALLLAAAAYHALLWWRRRSLVAYGWYALMIVGMALQMLTTAAAATGELGMAATYIGNFSAPASLAAPGAIYMLFALMDRARPPPWVSAFLFNSIASGVVITFIAITKVGLPLLQC